MREYLWCGGIHARLTTNTLFFARAIADRLTLFELALIFFLHLYISKQQKIFVYFITFVQESQLLI